MQTTYVRKSPAEILQNVDVFTGQNREFFKYLKEWADGLSAVRMEEIIKQAGGPEKVAVISVDVIEGFCRVGPLSSERVESIISPIVRVFKRAHQLGVENIALPQDAHDPEAEEFGAYPPHCVKGTKEAETVREFKELPFFDKMKVFPKNSINALHAPGLEEWLLEKDLKRIIVLGDCTDLCTYQLAMQARLLANSKDLDWEVIVPADAVDTYDMPVDKAKEVGAVPHPANLMHVIFLYHMMLNGVKIVNRVE